MSDECVTKHLTHSETVSLKDSEVPEEENYSDEQLVTTTLLVDSHKRKNQKDNQLVGSPETKRSKTISSSPSASSDSGHFTSDRPSPDITSLTTTPNGALQSMASASGESPTDYHHSWGMCATDVKVDLTSQTSHALQESESNIYSTSADHLNSPYSELSPTHQTYSNSFYESMQTTGLNVYQSPYSTSSGAAAAFANYSYANPYGGIISQSYNGSRSISSQCKSSSSTALAAPYLNPSPFSTSFTNSNSQTAQNAYNCYGQYQSSFSNSSANSQSFGNCQQSGLDYSTYSGFSHAASYSPYYASGYSGYIPNTSSSNINNGSPPTGLSSSNNSSNATYQLTQLPQQSDPNLSHYHHIEDCPSPHIKTEPHLNSSVGVKKGATKPRGRGRRQPNPSPDPENDFDRVFIWDLDGTIILLISYLNSNRVGEDGSDSYDLARQLEVFINHFAENHFFYDDLEDVDQSHVNDAATDDNGQDLSNYNFQNDGFHTTTSGVGLGLNQRNGVDWLRKMAFRYRKIKEVYTQYRDNVGGLLNNQERDHLFRIQAKWDTLTKNWTGVALQCLQQINSRPKCVNVLVTSLPLVPSLAKVMIFGLAPNFNIENIYSAAKTGKENIFERIIQNYGKKCTYVVIGDGKEEEAAAHKFSLPFWPVEGIKDLVAFHHALELGHL